MKETKKIDTNKTDKKEQDTKIAKIEQDKMKHKVYIDIEKQCGVLEFNKERIYLLDFEDFNMFTSFDKKFTFDTEECVYPSYNYNYQRINLLAFLHKIRHDYLEHVFINDNIFDLRSSNITFCHKLDKEIKVNYNIIEYFEGHYPIAGCDINRMKNPLWKVTDKISKKKYILMYCVKDTICKLCEKAYEKILEFEKTTNNNKKITFYKSQSGYILGHHSTNGNLYYIHQIIADCYGNGKGTKNISVDHIDQDPLNNSYENLRIATREEQEQNSNGIKEGTKRARNKNAKELPEEITQTMLPKYVIYYKECYNKDKQLYREFFKIEKHPKLGKPWISSKSCKINIKEKLLQVVKILNDLDNNIQPQEKKTLPLYITITHSRNKHHLVYDKKDEDGTRKNVRMVLPENYDIDTELLQFNQKILEKYPES